MRRSLLSGLVVLVAVVAAAVAARIYYGSRPAGPTPAAGQGPRVRLAVLVVFDQLRGDFLERWKPLFGRDGFNRLMTEGAWFTHCHYAQGTTATGPGHAAMLTGTCPDRHGIINNNWYEGGRVVYCAGSDRYELVPALPGGNGRGRGRDVGTPERLTAETLADVLKATYPTAKVFGLSLKDRSAILPTGRRPDGAFWFTSCFVTSTYYADRLPDWVEKFNASGAADRWYGRQWTRFRPDVNYDQYAGPDDAPGEGKGATVRDGPHKGWSQGVTFPHPMNPPVAGGDRPGREYYEALANSPFGNDLLAEFAKACVRAEQLGQRDVPDLLVVSFSSNDLVGHTWGPDSHEVLDITLRSDALMAEFLTFLDETVGRGRYVLALTADHGVCPLVEVSQARGRDARRVDVRELQRDLDAHLQERFGPPPGLAGASGRSAAWVEAFGEPGTFPWVYLNHQLVAAAGTTTDEVARVAAEFLRTRPRVARAYTRAELTAGPLPDPIGERVRRSYHPQRAGDVYVALREYDLPSRPTDPGTTHGAPYDYDTHVPLIVFGPGVAGGPKDEPTTPQAVAAILARWLGVRPPEQSEFPVPAALGE